MLHFLTLKKEKRSHYFIQISIRMDKDIMMFYILKNLLKRLESAKKLFMM